MIWVVIRHTSDGAEALSSWSVEGRAEAEVAVLSRAGESGVQYMVRGVEIDGGKRARRKERMRALEAENATLRRRSEGLERDTVVLLDYQRHIEAEFAAIAMRAEAHASAASAGERRDGNGFAAEYAARAAECRGIADMVRDGLKK